MSWLLCLPTWSVQVCRNATIVPLPILPPFDDFTRLRLPPISTPAHTSLGPRTLPPSNSAGAERHSTLPKMAEAEAAI